MSDRLTRAFAGDLDVRASGRTVAGIAVPFDTVARVRDLTGPAYQEKFARGAFTRTIAERGDRVKLCVSHDRRSLPIGRAVSLVEQPDGLHIEARVPATRQGDEALELVRDGVVDSLSIGFRPIASRNDRGVTVRTEARLDEVSLVSFGAYEDARITAVRSADQPRLTIARRRLVLARLAAGLTPEPEEG